MKVAFASLLVRRIGIDLGKRTKHWHSVSGDN